ncbi:MAG TPA: S46 family peptidase [Flavisolibacter sp.]
MNWIKSVVLTISFLVLTLLSHADEGMWLPQLLGQLNEKQMKGMGMKISAADIYSINKGSLKDAIVSFGGFCTAEVISEKGLILTNHHCGFDAIQNNSTLDHNYIKDGFWAKSTGEELPNAGLFATFIIRIDDVTKDALAGVTNGMEEKARQSQIDKNIAALRAAVKKETHQEVMVKAFFEGAQYYAFITETYRDVRLVGAPPSSIGNFGKDTDNWMWPRHTGDFSMFRIYAGPDGKPAPFSPNNVPYKPKKSLSISLDGMEKNDFTMVFGFPGRTAEYLPSVAVEQIVSISNPAKIAIRDRALSVMDQAMRKDEGVKIQYASKYAGVQNAYKKWQGEVLGINRTKALDKKRAYEAEFQKRVNAAPKWKEQYGSLLSDLTTAYAQYGPQSLARDYYNEVFARIELFSIASQLNRLQNALDRNGENGFNETLPLVKERLNEIYGEYNAEVDKQLFATLMEMYYTSGVNMMQPNELKKLADKGDNNYSKIADKLYNNTDLDNGKKIMEALEKDPKGLLQKFREDDVNKLQASINGSYNQQTGSAIGAVQNRINTLQRQFMQAQMEVFAGKKFYPDANSTLRVAYGKVAGYQPRDGVKYDNYTYLDGVMEKYKPGDYEFDVPQRLRDLYKAQDYGQYGNGGKMPVCFIATNHTTGGNSGSPVLDAYGNLIGLNFDRVWEGTMSDLNYDPSICRNIMVDIRYVLFIVDKYAGATHLIKEMKLVHPKKGL